MRKIVKAIPLIALIVFVVTVFYLYRLTLVTVINVNDIPEQHNGCTFVIKTNGAELNIQEPTSGVYKYELYSTSDGYLEVWKCN